MNTLPTMTDAEFYAFRREIIRNQDVVGSDHRESQAQNNVESSTEKSLDPLGETFPFQYRCGERHQFSYIENEEGVRLLSVKLSPSGHTFLGTLDPLAVCRTSEQRYIPVPLKSPNVIYTYRARLPPCHTATEIR